MTDETRPDEPQTESAATATETHPPAAEAEAAAEKEPEKLHQAVEVTDIGPCKKRVKVTIARDSIDARMNEKFKELVHEGTVPGFRPGKAPAKLVQGRYRKEVADQVKTEVLLASLQQLAEENDIAPLSAPDIDPFKIELPKDGPLVYEFEVEVRPQFDLPEYKGLKIKRPIHTFTEEEIAQEERRVLAPYGQIVPKEDGVAQIGDILVADVVTRDGERELGTFKEYMVRVEPRLAFKDGVAENFGEQVRGAKAGDKRVVDIVLSRSVADQSLAGKRVQATFEVKDVKTLRLPELTHEFLHRFGVHTPEQFRELVLVSLQRKLEYLQRQSARQQVTQHIAASATWELPEDLLIRQARKAFARRVMEMQAQGISDEEIRARQRLLEQDVLTSTAAALKEHFVLQKIAEVEKIDVSDDDIEDEIERIAEQNDESPRRVRARLEKDDLMEALAVELIERKTLDLILDNAEYEDVPLKGQEQAAVATVEEQAVPGEMHDPTAAPPEAPAASGPDNA
jgi:trigger factor